MKKLLKSKLFRVFVLIIFLMAALLIYYFQAVTLDPPKIENPETFNLTRDSVAPGVYTCKNSWLRKNRAGLYEMYLEGKPFELGRINGLLSQDLLNYQEQVFVDRLREMVPSPGYLNTLKYFVAWFNRDMDDFVPLEYQQEIYGVSMAASEDFNFIAHNYQRILNYHAAHDIGHAMQNMNLVACTAFAAWDEKTEDSSLIIGRNFDFYMGEDFARNKIVTFLHPENGYRLMMITWGGMTGVVSGMNEKGLTITLNAAKSSIPTKAKTPVSLLARLILQYASTIDEAIKIAGEHETFVSESFLIGSAADHKAVVIEKSPGKTGIFYPEKSTLVVTNHFQSVAFADDELNLENKAESASLYRQQRVEESLNANQKLNPTKTASILRDKRGLNDASIGLGNEKAVDQLIAHHSIIFKPEQLLVWVSTQPYQEGEYLCYDLNKIFFGNPDFTKEIDESGLAIPADTFLLSTDWANFLEYRQLTEHIKKRLDNGEKGFLSDPEIEHYLSLNPDFYYPHFLIGKYYQTLGNTEKAEVGLKMALEKEIPRKVDREEVEGVMNILEK